MDGRQDADIICIAASVHLLLLLLLSLAESAESRRLSLSLSVSPSVCLSYRSRGCKEDDCEACIAIGLSHARPNSGISGDLLSENEAKPAVI